MKIYIASKTKYAARWRDLRSSGVNIISTWIDSVVTDDMVTPQLAINCINECKDCDMLILYAEGGDVLRDALVEYGAALGAGKRVVIVGDCSSIAVTLAMHPNVRRFDTMQQALTAAQPTPDSSENPPQEIEANSGNTSK